MRLIAIALLLADARIRPYHDGYWNPECLDCEPSPCELWERQDLDGWPYTF